jgi:hypothetical protein
MTKRNDPSEQSSFDFASVDRAEPEGADQVARASEVAAAISIGDGWPIDLTQRGPCLGAERAVDGELTVLVLEAGHAAGKGFAADVARPARGHTPAEPFSVVGVEPLGAAEPS